MPTAGEEGSHRGGDQGFLRGNLCRCTGYVNIIKGVKRGAKTRGGR